MMKKLLQKAAAVLLSAAAVLALAAGNGFVPIKSTEAAAADKKITVKAASDFTLKFPACWKNQYVKKASRDKKHGSYVAFYSKKCYKETKEGWLFSIMRFEDDSYQEMPAWKLAGRWNGMNYVISMPKSVPLEGVPEDAVKQYRKLARSAEKAFYTIQP